VLTEPVVPGSHAGVLFMDNQGYPFLSGHGIPAVTTIALDRGLLDPGGDSHFIVFDTPAGTIRARAERRGGRTASVAFTLPPAIVVRAGVQIAFGARRLRIDIASAGLLYAIVDAESAGVPLDGAHVPELRRAGRAIAKAAAIAAGQPLSVADIQGTIFTGPSQSGAADLRSVTVSAGGALDRSACGTATAAVMAVLEAMGLLDGERWFTQESILGTTLRGRVSARTVLDDVPAIVTEIEASAWITGEHVFSLDAGDPLREGFQLDGDQAS
jgi:proline racemase